jgi:uncharacterized protein (TIGR03435 family)
MNRDLASMTAAAALSAVIAGILPHSISAQTAASPAAQAPPDAPLPGFEATIKRNQAGDGMMSMRMDPQGRTISGLPLRQLIVQAYGIQPNQLIGGPDWLASDRWDIQLRADGPVAPPQMNLLFQQMLASRFKLVVHRETRELPIYELRLARADGKPGPDLKPAAVDCGAQGRGRPGGPPPGGAAVPPPGGPAGRGGPGLGGGCMMMMSPGNLQAAGQPLSGLTNFLANQLGRQVIDNLPPGAPVPPPIDPNGPSLFTAVQEQLVFKLEPQRGPVEVLVIDSVQQPTEN